jgi:O-antigen ligase/tetratricopeptide (TPR) repeat protein
MQQRELSLDKVVTMPSRFEVVIEWLLVALLAFMPLAFGARAAWSEEIVIILSGIIAICFSLKLLYRRQEGIVWTWCYIPIALFLALAVFQLISLPTFLVSMISPNTARLKTELLSDLLGVDGLKLMPISFYPNATKHDLRLVLSAGAVFIVVLNVFRHPAQIKRLLLAITLIGGIVASIALAQDIFGNGRIYWLVATPNGIANSGPFINHNHYGQFMNLSFGAGLGWLCVRLHERFGGSKRTPPAVLEYLSSGSAKVFWLVVLIMSVGAATVFVSLSRGGMASMLIVAAFTTMILTWKQSLKGAAWVIVIVALTAFTWVLYIGFDAVYERFGTLSRFQGYAFRWQILKDLVASYKQFPLFGTGLGTYSVVYPMFSRANSPLLFTHAEDEYAQVASETGIVGLVLLIVFGIIVGVSYVRNIRKADSPICSAAYGLGFGIGAILIHSLSDYGQHVPANAFLSVISCALLVSLAKQGEGRACRSNVVTPADFWDAGALRIIVFLGVSGIVLWSFVGADKARIAEFHWAKALSVEKQLRTNDWKGSDAEYKDLILHATKASEYEPGNVRYQHWLSVYHWHSVSQTVDPDTGELPEGSLERVRDIADRFRRVCAICPTYGPAYCTMGQLEEFILGDEAGSRKIRKGFQLAPCDPIVCFVAGKLDVLEGRIEDSITKFQKAVSLDGTLFKDVVYMYVHYLSRPHLAIMAAGDDISRLNYVANVLEDMQYQDLVAQLRQKVRRLLETRSAQPETPAWVFAALGNICKAEQENETAIEYYCRALTLDYGQVHWRLALAKLLVDEKKVPEAMHEARICLRIRPQFKEAEKLVRDMSLHPQVLNEEHIMP